MKAQQTQTLGSRRRRAGSLEFGAPKSRPSSIVFSMAVGRLCVHESTSRGLCPHICCQECRGTLTLELECLVLPVTCSAWQHHLGMLLPTDRHCLLTPFCASVLLPLSTVLSAASSKATLSPASLPCSRFPCKQPLSTTANWRLWERATSSAYRELLCPPRNPPFAIVRPKGGGGGSCGA